MTLSVIVPVYNKVKYIDACIKSILAQTLADFELILINDGSSDKSGERCDHFKTIDKRVIVIHQPNKGVSAARNAGLNICKGEFIGFVDADDILDYDMYETLVRNAKKYEADISICGVRRVSPKKTTFLTHNSKVKLYNKNEGVSGLFKGEILMSNYEKIFRNETVKSIRFEPALFEDTYYNFEALKSSKLTVYDSAVKYNYMIRENSHSLAPFNQKYMNMVILTKKMVDLCAEEMPEHIEEAKAFDFNSNMMVLNIIIFASKKVHQMDYELILNNLKEYFKTLNSLKGVSLKYKYSYYLLLVSPKMYIAILKLYSFITNSEYLDRRPSKQKVTSS